MAVQHQLSLIRASPSTGLRGATRAVNQARACYNLLYLVTSYLFPYLSFGRGRCGAICLPLLEPVAKKCLSRFTSHSLSLQPAPSLCLPKARSPCFSSFAPSSTCPRPHQTHFCHSWPRDRKNHRLLSLYLHILSVIRYVWTHGVLASEPSFTIFEFVKVSRRGMECSLPRKPKERAPYFFGEGAVITEGLRSQGHHGREAGKVKQKEGPGFGDDTVVEVGGMGLETLMEGEKSV